MDTTDPTPPNITPDNDVVDNTMENEKTQGIFVSMTAHLLYAMNEFMMFLLLQPTKFYSTETSPEVDNANADGTPAETTHPTRPNITPDNDVVDNAADNEKTQGYFNFHDIPFTVCNDLVNDVFTFTITNILFHRQIA